MSAVANGRNHGRKAAPVMKRHVAGWRGQRMRDVPNVEFEPGTDASAIDVLGAEFCARIARDLADGGCGEGADVRGADPDGWLQSEADGAHLLQKA